MKCPRFFEGVGAAFALALLASILATAPVPVDHPAVFLRLLISLMCGLYLSWLIVLREPRAGKATAVLAWAVAAAGAWLFVDDLTIFGSLHVGLLWLVRTVMLHRGPLASIAELLLSVFAGIAAAVALARTGSAFLGVWTFFLLLATSDFVPGRAKRNASETPLQAGSEFLRAEQIAESALERLIERQQFLAKGD